MLKSTKLPKGRINSKTIMIVTIKIDVKEFVFFFAFVFLIINY